jgi:hypothetical protein
MLSCMLHASTKGNGYCLLLVPRLLTARVVASTAMVACLPALPAAAAVYGQDTGALYGTENTLNLLQVSLNVAAGSQTIAS